MSDTTTSGGDPFVAETQRIFDELAEAKALTVGIADADPFAIARTNRAMTAAQQHRKMLRQVGQLFGDRAYPTDAELAAGVDPDMIIGLAVEDNADTLPTIIEGA